MNNEAYWKQRAEEREKEWNKLSKDTIEKELAKYYEQALSRIEDDIAILYGKYAKDNNLTYAEATKLLTGSEFKQWRMSMSEYLDDIAEDKSNKLLLELNTLVMRKRISRLDKLYADTLKNLHKLGVNTENNITKFLTKAYKDNYYKNLFDLGKTIGIKSSVSEVNDKEVQKVLNSAWSGKNYSKRIWKNTDNLAKLIKSEVTDGFHRGVSIDKMSKLVQERMGVGKYEATRLVRTEMNYVQNQAALNSIKEADMRYYIFLATLDKKTSKKCRNHDRKVYPVSEGSPGSNMPPLHPHCRSTIAGNLTDYNTGRGKRTARDDNNKRIIIPASMNYNDYYKVYIQKSMTLEEWETSFKYDRMKENSNKFTFDTVNTFDDLKNLAIQKWGIKTIDKSVFKLNFKAVKNTFKGMDKVFDYFPQLKTTVEEINTSKYGIMCTDLTKKGSTISFNPKYYMDDNIKDFIEVYKYNLEKKHFPNNTDIYSSGIHELGHSIEAILVNKLSDTYSRTNNWNKCIFAKEIVKEATKRAKKHQEGKGKLKNELILEISGYAGHSPSETMAEAVNDYFANYNDAKILSKMIIEVTKEWLEDDGKTNLL